MNKSESQLGHQRTYNIKPQLQYQLDNSSDDDDDDDESQFADHLAKIEGLNINYKTAGYQDYLDYISALKSERNSVKKSLSEVKEHLTQMEAKYSRNLTLLKDELNSMSFSVEVSFRI